MKYVDEYRDEDQALRYVEAIRGLVTRPWTLMEICGGQTHTIIRSGIDEMLPDAVDPRPRSRLPGLRDAARADRPGAGDRTSPRGDPHVLRRHAARTRLRRPTCSTSRPRAATCGSSTRRWTPSKLAEQNPDREVVFFAVGFETTAPANAMAVLAGPRARARELLGLVLARPRAAGHGGDPRRAGQPRPGLPGRRSRLRGHGLLGVRPDRRQVRGPHRRDRFRAARPAAGRLHDLEGARRGPLGGGEPVHAVGDARGQRAGAGASGAGSSRPATASGAASARSPPAATGCARSSSRTTPRASSTSARSWRRSLPSASRARFSPDGRSPTSARRSGRVARQSTPWARPWCRPKAPARPTSATAATSASPRRNERGEPARRQGSERLCAQLPAAVVRVPARPARPRRRRQAVARASSRRSSSRAFGNPILAPAARRRGARDRRRPPGVLHRLLRRAPAVLSRGRHRLAGRPRHRERPRHVRCPAPGDLRRVHPRGGLPDGRPVAHRRVDARRRREAGVPVVTGDTKVVDRGKGDGVFINTTGIGCGPGGGRDLTRSGRAPATSSW